MMGCEPLRGTGDATPASFGRCRVPSRQVACASKNPQGIGPDSIAGNYQSEGGIEMAKLVGLCMASVAGLNRGRMGGRYVWAC